MDLLPFDPDAVSGLCAELDAWRERLDDRGPLPRRWAGRLRRELEAEAVAASTSMEGVPVTVDEVRRILSGAPPSDVRQEDQALVEGYRAAMGFVLRRADDPTFAWSRELIVALHDRALSGRYELGAGRLRVDRPAFVVNSLTGEQVFLPPAGQDAAGLVDDVCGRLDNWTDHPALASAWVHVALAAIHPFRDGNGRVARVAASLAMYRGGFRRPEFTTLEEWWGRHLAEYYGAFGCLGDEFSPATDVTPFVREHVRAHLHQVRALDAREWVQRQVWTALESIAGDAHLHERVANALWDAFFSHDVTAGYYRNVADVSAATATNDLSGAVSAGLLRPEGQRRGRRYVAKLELFEAVAAALDLSAAGSASESRGHIVSELARRRTRRAAPD